MNILKAISIGILSFSPSILLFYVRGFLVFIRYLDNSINHLWRKVTSSPSLSRLFLILIFLLDRLISDTFSNCIKFKGGYFKYIRVRRKEFWCLFHFLCLPSLHRFNWNTALVSGNINSPSLFTSTLSHSESALTTDTPTHEVSWYL